MTEVKTSCKSKFTNVLITTFYLYILQILLVMRVVLVVKERMRVVLVVKERHIRN